MSKINVLNKDRVALKLKVAIENGTIDKKHIYLKCYLKNFNELSIIKDLILKGNYIYIPSSLRKKILNAAHEGHQEIVKTRQLLRSQNMVSPNRQTK